MKLVRVLIAGLIVTVFGAIVGMTFCGGIFKWIYQLEPTAIWKPMEGAPSPAFFVGSYVLSVILAIVYMIIRKGLPTNSRIVKGFVYGLCVWAVGVLPGMFSMYFFMIVAPTVLIYWTVLGLCINPIQGMLIALICGR